MQLDTEKMLAKIKNSQWALADIDWDAPGRELVTENPELYPKLKIFMADLMWIEHVGARAFAAMAKKARTTRWPRSTATSMPKNSATPMSRWR